MSARSSPSFLACIRPAKGSRSLSIRYFSASRLLQPNSFSMVADAADAAGASRVAGSGQDKTRTAKPKPEKKEVKILMLHGYTQSGPLFRSKTRAVEKLLQKSLAPFALSPILIYPTGPLRLSPADVPGFAPTPAASAEAASESAPQELDAWSWFRRDETTQRYEQFDRGIRTLAEAMRGAGGVDGVVGFSQGGALAALVAALMEKPERTLPEGGEFGFVEELRAANGGRPLKFSVIYSGFIARDETLASWLYEPPIATPTLHFLGSLDTVVEESRSQGLVDCCKDSVVVVHPGGHYVPVAKEWVMPLIGFVKKYSENA